MNLITFFCGLLFGDYKRLFFSVHNMLKEFSFDLLVIKEILRLNFRDGSTFLLPISVLPLQRICLMYLHAYIGH